MSFWVSAIAAAKMAVKTPMLATTHIAVGALGEDRVGAGDHVDAGVDHRGGVDQGADRGRALHRVRQPDVQRELGALADRAGEEQQGDQRDLPLGSSVADPREDLVELQRARARSRWP